jgi:hypothetical protein
MKLKYVLAALLCSVMFTTNVQAATPTPKPKPSSKATPSKNATVKLLKQLRSPAHPKQLRSQLRRKKRRLRKLQHLFLHLHQFGHQLDLLVIKESMQKFRQVRNYWV